MDKKRIRLIVLKVLALIGVTFFIFLLYVLFALSILLKIASFVQLNNTVWIISIMVGLVLSFAISFLAFHNFEKEYSFVWFLKDHFQGFVTSYIFLILFINSIQNEITIGVDGAKDFISIQWAIFAITVGAFAVWHALIFNKVYFGDKKPIQLEDNESLIAKEINSILSLSEKHESYQEYVRKIDPLVFILINLISIILATGSIFLFKEYKAWNESIVIFSFYCSTNTLINVIFDISIDLFTRRRELIKTTKVKASEYNEALDSIKAIALIEEFANNNPFLIPNNTQIENKEIDDCIKRLSFIVEEYKKDKSTFEKYKNEFVILIKTMDALRKKYSRTFKRRRKKQESEI